MIVPTHDATYLAEAVESVRAQTHGDWEVVLVPNGGVELPEFADPRVRVAPLPFESDRIGAIKGWAFSQGTGDVLLELDHDDILLPTALERVAEAFADPSVGFVYSNFAEFNHADWSAREYGPEYGWKVRDFEYRGHGLREMVAFEPSPQSVSLIWYAPNHLRAWRRSVYEEVGGHDPELRICDDQDLLCRTYLASRLHHIDECLYLYRVHGNNAWIRYNADIQAKNWEIYSKYIGRLCAKRARDEGLLAVDLCGGFDAPEGYLSVDLEGGDVTADLDGPWPFQDGSVGVVRASDALEHLRDKRHAMSEIHRVLAPGGMLLSATPAATGNGAFMDPTHVSCWVEQSFWYYTRAEQARYIRNASETFSENRLGTLFPTDWHRANNIPYVIADLTKLGADGLPGIKRI